MLTDRSFFDHIPHTLIDFETHGDGSPVELPPFSEGLAMPVDEYAAQGVVFDEGNDIGWLSSGRFQFQEVLASGGSPAVALSANGFSGFLAVEFTVAVRAFGLFAISGRLREIPPPPPPGFRAFDADGNLLGEAFLEGPFLDGTIEFFEFGFMGFASEGALIQRVEFVNAVFFAFDDLRFSSVPAPGGLAVMGLAALATGRRKRAIK